MRKHIKAQKKLHGMAFKLYRNLVGLLNLIPMSYKKELGVLYRGLALRRVTKTKSTAAMSLSYFVYRKVKSISSMNLVTRVHLHISAAQG